MPAVNPLMAQWKNPTPVQRYGAAAGVSLGALLLSLALRPLVTSTPGVFFFAAVVLAAWYGGWGPSLVAACFSAVALNVWFLGTTGTLSLTATDLARAGLFLVTSVLVSWASEGLRLARDRAELARSVAETTQEQLAAEREIAVAQAERLQIAHAELQSRHAELRELDEALRQSNAALHVQQGRLTFLLDASLWLAASLDSEEMLRELGRLSLPRLGDWCIIDLAAEDMGSGPPGLPPLALAADPDRQPLAQALEACFPPDLGAVLGAAGSPLLRPEIDDALLASAAQSPEQLRLLREIAPRASMSVPLVARGRTLGTLLFLACGDRWTYGAEDLALAEDLARRAALALDTARLHEALHEAARRKDEFLAMLAHELRNPLVPIVNSLQLLEAQAGDSAPLQRVHALIDRQVSHITRLVDDLLDVARVTRGMIELRKETVDLAAAAAHAAQARQPLFDTRGQTLTTSLPDEPLWIEADPVRLAQVIDNLLNNAAKYTDPGGRIWLTVAREGDTAVLHVRDTGQGIAPDLLPAIFDPFTQADRSLARSQGGLGIGLTLVRQLVEQHGGRVTASSGGPGQGSDFRVTLPALPPERARVEPARPPEERSRAAVGHRIVVVEDNPDARETLEELLELRGHAVESAPDGLLGLELLLTARPRVGLIDIGLPRLDGYEVARRARLELGTDIYLAAITGYGRAEDREQALAAGFDAHLVKPLDPEELYRLLETVPSAPRPDA